MNNILRHTLSSKTAQRAASYVSSPLRRVGAGSRALGLQRAGLGVVDGVGGA